MIQPRNELNFPPSGVLQAGKTYRFPFTFVVPPQLLPRSCTHKCANSQVKDTHLHLPPSFGDPELAGDGVHLLDDMAPAMAKVSYFIRARLIRDHDGPEALVSEATKKLLITPAFEEQPPLNIDGHDDDYKMRLEKTVRKGFMKGKLGKLVIESSQPKSFRLPAVSPGESNLPVSTMAKVQIRFDPQDANSPPPRLSSLVSKLKVTTFFASSPRHRIPVKGTTFPDMSQGYITETLSLSTLCIASVEWTPHRPGESPAPPSPLLAPPRRDSAMSQTSTASTASKIAAPSSSHRPANPFYTATILVPLSLPTATKHFVPTFHSCIVSRVYALAVSLAVQGQPLSPALTLKLPVQVSADGSPGSVERRRQSEQLELAFMEADAVFEPRAVGRGSVADGAASDLPPGYDGLGFGGGSSVRTEGGLGHRVISGVSVYG